MGRIQKAGIRGRGFWLGLTLGLAITAGPSLSQPPPSSPTLIPSPAAGAAAGPTTAPAAGSLTLAAEALAAIQRNPEMVQAAAQLRASGARLNEQLALQSPQYGLTTAITGTKASGYGVFPTLNTVLSIPIDTAGRNGQLIRQARAELSAARWTYRRSESDLSYQVATAYYGVLRADQETVIAADTYAQAQAQQAAAQKRLDAGDAPETDVLKAEVQVAQTRSDLLLAQSNAAQARASLNNLTVTPLSAPVNLTGSSGLASSPPPVETMRTRADAEAPEVRNAQDMVTSADAALALARLEGRPSVSLEGVYTHTGDPTTYPDAVGAGVSINIPLPDGGGRRSRENEAKAALAQANAGLDLARNQALLNLQNAYLALDDAHQRTAITGQGVTLATESLRAANLGYTNGVATARDVIDAQVALRQARIQNTEAIYAYNLADARIYNVLGGAPPGITMPGPPNFGIERPAPSKVDKPAGK